MSRSNDNAPVLALVIPCYNEESALPETARALNGEIDGLAANGRISRQSYMLCVDDGSTDNTWEAIRQLGGRTKGIRLTRNFGQQNAISAGLEYVTGHCDCAVTLDADLQDDPSVIAEMLDAYADGYETVYGIRKSRKSDSPYKRCGARLFYRLRSILTKENVYDHSDYRLMSDATLQRLALFSESNLYLRGIMPLIGGKSCNVYYDRASRVAGVSKYSTRRMISLGLDGITSFSSRPIRAIFFAGLIFLFLDVAVAVYVAISYFRGDSIRGWTSLMLSVWFLGSMLLMAIGLVGEYIGKIFSEVKHRPRYIIEQTTDETHNNPQTDPHADNR